MINSRKMERYYVCVIGEVPEKISDKMMDFILVRAFFRRQHQVKVQALIPTLRFKKQHNLLMLSTSLESLGRSLESLGRCSIDRVDLCLFFQDTVAIYL